MIVREVWPDGIALLRTFRPGRGPAVISSGTRPIGGAQPDSPYAWTAPLASWQRPRRMRITLERFWKCHARATKSARCAKSAATWLARRNSARASEAWRPMKIARRGDPGSTLPAAPRTAQCSGAKRSEPARSPDRALRPRPRTRATPRSPAPRIVSTAAPCCAPAVDVLRVGTEQYRLREHIVLRWKTGHRDSVRIGRAALTVSRRPRIHVDARRRTRAAWRPHVGVSGPDDLSTAGIVWGLAAPPRTEPATV